MLRARYRGSLLFRVFATVVVVAFVLASTGVGYAVQGAVPDGEPGVQPVPPAPIEEPAPPPEQPADPAPAPQPVPAPQPEPAPAPAPEPDPAPAPQPDTGVPAAPDASGTVPDPAGAPKASVGGADGGGLPECSPAPKGVIIIHKFEDLDGDGTDDTEPPVAGVTFDVTKSGMSPKTVVTGPDGSARVSGLFDGAYTVTERVPEGWAPTGPTHLHVTLSGCDTDHDPLPVHVGFGNRRIEHTKTFELRLTAPTQASGYFVTFDRDGSPQRLELTGSPLRAHITVPHGTALTRIRWWATWNGQDVVLEADDGVEHICSDVTNRATYGASLSGGKYWDQNADGTFDAGEPWLSGWTITLSRLTPAGPVPYGTAVTDGKGLYSFHGVLPGDYVLTEESRPGWVPTQLPASPISVADGTCRLSLLFGNRHQTSGISVVKTGPAAAHVGDVVDYTITVRNAGESALSDVSVDDSIIGGVALIPSLASGASMTFVRSYIVGPNDPDPLRNTVTARGTDPLGTIVSDEARWDVDIIHPAMTLDKSVDPEMILKGESVEYRYVVANTGDCDLLDIDLIDDVLGPIGTIGVLPAGGTRTFVVPAAPTADVVNTAYATGHDVLLRKLSASDTARLDVYDPSIALTKSVAPQVVLPGEPVTYTYVVSNTGNAVLHDVAVVDDVLGPIGSVPVMLPGESFTMHAPYAPLADVVNTATARGEFRLPQREIVREVSASAMAAVDVVHPAITVDKTVDRPVIVSGESVTYRYTVTNTGDVPLDYDLTDDVLGPIASGRLAVGGTAVHEKDASPTTDTVNVATVLAHDDHGHEVDATARARVSVLVPSVRIVKDASPGVVLAGEPVVYSYTVVNDGQVPLHDLVVTDDREGTIGTIVFLPPAATAPVMTHEATLSADTTNVATVVGRYTAWTPQGPAEELVEVSWLGSVTAHDDAFVDVIRPDISVTKTSDAPAEGVLTGTPVTYTYTVRNSGDQSLFGVSVEDDKLGSIAGDLDLAVGEERSYTRTITAFETVTNVVTATGWDRYEHKVVASASHTVLVFAPATFPDLALTKTASRSTAGPGDAVTYTLRIRNVGDASAQGWTLRDDYDQRYMSVSDAGGGYDSGGGLSWSSDEPLAPGASVTISYVMRVVSPVPEGRTHVDNVAIVRTEGDTDPGNDRATARVDIGEGLPYLPFTGGDTPAFLWLALVAAVSAGVLALMRARLAS